MPTLCGRNAFYNILLQSCNASISIIATNSQLPPPRLRRVNLYI